MERSTRVQSATITGTEVREEGGKKFTVYKVELRSEIGPWVVWRRYRQFHELDAKIKERNPSFPGRLPQKKMGGNMKPEFVEERKNFLQQYLKDLVADPNAAGSPEFRAFIDANRSCSGKLSDALGSGSGASSSTKQKLQRKIAVLGFMGVGKSAVTIQFTEGHFAEPYSPTIENTFQKVIRHKGIEYQTDILDTAGQDEYQIFHTRYAMGIHGYILMYSIVSRRSFDMVSTIRDKLLNAVGTENIPHVLVGNKSDLVHEREVATEEGQRLADEWGVPFIESSAKFNTNIEEIFRKLILQCEAGQEGSDGEKKCLIM
ncbi:hypothetical protein GUITHDRAFT_175447 [Guillardia theta CCMP2712]|uniref:PX domain-containing protein n=1 Tax=Guillardia theta (strain CCMP2712) TaxID=905079 RepID=L1J4R2_GUITC|nr:hypothetical protein GUITHDRAFT_175447 [Guillardia theta CCMP2712]EKX43523.1 hypothetical protein GUITHDRAFT_175447 [Guillardia theta CCMP2712]|eukprot:XP_005830503.1 hypothetical protein GUITHDRAFT_175447 [Guillardia theta CCMP2712]